LTLLISIPISKTIYVLFFIELGTRRVHLAGCTTKPDLTGVTQLVRQRVWNLEDDAQEMPFLIHDNDDRSHQGIGQRFPVSGSNL
jgi:putative transposase